MSLTGSRLHNLYTIMLLSGVLKICSMFKVFIQDSDFKEVEFFRCDVLQDAVAMALGLYRSSNVDITLTVFDVKEDVVAISFVKKS